MRTLIHVRIVHSPGDMGSLGSRLATARGQHDQTQRWWERTRGEVQGLPLDWSGVKVYQDGLPDAEKGAIERILAEVDSPNYDLLRWLVGRGATLIGTESPGLLREEYDCLQAIVKAESPAARTAAQRRYAERAAALLAERDAYIGRRIGDTLGEAQVGILFIGRAHDLLPHLPGDIAVKPLPDGD